jgi:magnesium transporter
MGEDETPMASNRPNPASPSEPTPGRPGALAPRFRAPVTRSGGPGAIRVLSVEDGELRETLGDAALAELPDLLDQSDTSVWVDLTSPTPDLALRVGAALELHPLIVEDILEGNQRAKIETTDGQIHIVLFNLTYGERVDASELDFVLGEGYLLTVHDAAWDPRATNHLRSGVAPVLRHGPDHLLWALADDLVDGYFPFADRLGDAIDDVQDEVVRTASRETVERMFLLKRELIAVRRAVSPVREVFNQLTNRDIALISPDELVYFRDIYDHVIRLTDELDNYRELAATTLDVYLTQVNNNLSVIMKRLTGVTVLLAGIAAIAGIFGMSEAGLAIGGAEAGGFWLVTVVTIALAVGAAFFLRRIDWI